MRSAALLPFVLLGLACDAGGAGDRAGDARGLGPDGAEHGIGMASSPEAVSLLGQELYALPTDPATAARLDAQLDTARTVYEAHPDDPDALIWLGRRLAYAGRYRDAIDAFTEGVERFSGDARFYRHRGHRYITVRELDRAVEDLDHAARLTGGQEDVVEPDGMPNEAGVPRSTLQTNIWYHLALARYLRADFERAAHAFRHGLSISPNDDMRVAMADWLWMALMRLDREEDAAAAIDFVRPEMEILENEAYHRRLLLYRGILSPDSLAPALARDAESDSIPTPESGDPKPEGDRALQLATYGYGLGHWYLLRGNRFRAREVFEAVLDTGYWPAFGYIAAEAELARWDDPSLPPPD